MYTPCSLGRLEVRKIESKNTYLALPGDLFGMDCSITNNITPRDLFNKDMISTHQKIENERRNKYRKNVELVVKQRKGEEEWQ
jgi:hypothetical protein